MHSNELCIVLLVDISAIVCSLRVSLVVSVSTTRGSHSLAFHPHRCSAPVPPTAASAAFRCYSEDLHALHLFV